MEKIILIHGSGHKSDSWSETASHLDHRENILCPELSAILDGREASYSNLRTAFETYCAQTGGPVHLCGLSLGGILALDYVLEHPENVETLVLIGTPHKVPKGAFALQNVVFRLLPKSTFTSITARVNTSQGVRCRAVADQLPPYVQAEEPTLEDAYLYLISREAVQ